MKIKNQLTILLLIASIIATLTACGGEKSAIGADSAPQSSQQLQSDQESAQIPNPWSDCENQQEAQDMAGFEITLPSQLPQGYGEPSFRVITGEVLEADYAGAGEAQLCIRKAAGTQDPSGDYNDYPDSQQVTVDGLEVTMKGSGDAVALAVWQDGTNAYSIGIYNGDGISTEEMTELIRQMMG